jgi:protein SCO1/2
MIVLVMLFTYLMVKPPVAPAELEGVLRSEFKQLQPFVLRNHDNRLINDENFQGKWNFVFFGYVSCPDICPASLQVLNTVYQLARDEVSEDPVDFQVMFVSVDPTRDSAKILGDYVGYFNNKFIAATADKSQIDKLTRQFGAGYLIEAESTTGQYNVAHASAIFLVDPRGRLVASFSQPHYPSTIMSQFKKIKTYFAEVG